MASPFEILQISENSSPTAIKERWRELRWSAHPDHGGTAEGFSAMRDAYNRAMVLAENMACATCKGAGEIKIVNGPHSLATRCPHCYGTKRQYPPVE